MISRARKFTLPGLLAATAIAIFAPEAGAWGRLAHRASARVAEGLLTPNARAAVRDLLEPGESLADASTWADEVRSERKHTAPWHYVNVPIDETQYDPKFCPAEGCVVSAIAAMKATLSNPDAPRAERREALRFLVHFVQDMHQPLHVGHRGDRGGNDTQVQFFGKGSNLHRVWDSQVLEQHVSGEDAWVKELETLATPENREKWNEGTTEEWATESLKAARSAYLDGTLKKGAKLGESYQEASLPIARERLAQSAVRLAFLINGLFP